VIDRRVFLAGVAGVALAPPFAVVAQLAGKIYRIGYRGQGSKSSEISDKGALGRPLQNMRALGYVEGVNLTVELSIYLTTAKVHGLTMPWSLLARADGVIQ
jgi:hypothetical protein